VLFRSKKAKKKKASTSELDVGESQTTDKPAKKKRRVPEDAAKDDSSDKDEKEGKEGKPAKKKKSAPVIKQQQPLLTAAQKKKIAEEKNQEEKNRISQMKTSSSEPVWKQAAASKSTTSKGAAGVVKDDKKASSSSSSSGAGGSQVSRPLETPLERAKRLTMLVEARLKMEEKKSSKEFDATGIVKILRKAKDIDLSVNEWVESKFIELVNTLRKYPKSADVAKEASDIRSFLKAKMNALADAVPPASTLAPATGTEVSIPDKVDGNA